MPKPLKIILSFAMVLILILVLRNQVDEIHPNTLKIGAQLISPAIDKPELMMSSQITLDT